MPRNSFRCDPNRLKLLLEDSLPQPQAADMVGHLDHCTACQQRLEALAADRRWWEELPRMKAIAEQGESAHTAALGEQPTTPDRAEAIALDFLNRSDDPAHLGRLGPFAVTGVLGRGGMGVVLKGFDAALNRPVAIKVLAPHFASSGAARKRFARESQAAAAVVHEHVVAIHSVDTWKGLPYLVMSLVSGRSLQERLDREGPLQVKEILRIGMQAASGLAAAHAQGLVHRDVKPANILLENGVERVRLTDFGLARAVDDASLTQSGVVAGTPQYMAPEQARGDPIGPLADLFSLGSTLYTMAAGHPPFRAESAMAVLHRICNESPRPLRTMNPEVPTWLAAMIEKLHAKEPSDRFQSAAEVADLLGRCLAHLEQPDTVPLPPELAGMSRTRGGRWRRWVAAASIFCALSAGAAVWGTPLGQFFFPAADGEPVIREGERHSPPPAPIKEGDSTERQLQMAQEWTGALEADLTQHPAAGLADPTEHLLREAQQKLRAVERELGETGAPGA